MPAPPFDCARFGPAGANPPDLAWPLSGEDENPRSRGAGFVPAHRTGADPRGTATSAATGAPRADRNDGRSPRLTRSQLTARSWTQPRPKYGRDTTVHAL